MNTKIVKLDINRNLYDILTAKQGDTQSRFLLFQLLDGAIPFSLENRSVKVFATKPDGKEVFNDLIINDRVKGYCTLELTNQMLAVPGLLKLELMVIEGDKKLTTNVFYMDVKKSINSENAIVSTNEFSALLNGLASLNEYDNYKNEIAAARDGEVNLLTKVKKIDEHLEHNILEATKRNLINTSNYKKEPTFVFIDDDGTKQFLTKLKPIFDKKGYKCGISIVAEKVESVSGKYYMCLDDLKKLQNEGYEILNHSNTHSNVHWRDSIDLDLIEKDIKDGQNFMLKNGFPLYDILVYPYGLFNDNKNSICNVAKKYCRVGINASNNLKTYNDTPCDNMYLERIFLNKNADITYYTNMIDECIENNGWMIFGTHSGSDEIDGEYLEQIINYIESKSCKISRFSEAYKEKGNVIALGEYNTKGSFYLGVNGKHNLSVNLIDEDLFNMNTPMENFEQGKVTYTAIRNSDDIILGEGGVLQTVRFFTDIYSYQIFKPLITNITFIKRNGQTVFTPIEKEFFTKNTINRLATDSIDTFIKGVCEISTIWGSNPTIEQFPESSAGLLKTFRHLEQDLFSYQEYQIRGTNKIYRRFYNGSSFGDFQKISAI